MLHIHQNTSIGALHMISILDTKQLSLIDCIYRRFVQFLVGYTSNILKYNREERENLVVKKDEGHNRREKCYHPGTSAFFSFYPSKPLILPSLQNSFSDQSWETRWRTITSPCRESLLRPRPLSIYELSWHVVNILIYVSEVERKCGSQYDGLRIWWCI